MAASSTPSDESELISSMTLAWACMAAHDEKESETAHPAGMLDPTTLTHDSDMKATCDPSPAERASELFTNDAIRRAIFFYSDPPTRAAMLCVNNNAFIQLVHMLYRTMRMDDYERMHAWRTSNRFSMYTSAVRVLDISYCLPWLNQRYDDVWALFTIFRHCERILWTFGELHRIRTMCGDGHAYVAHRIVNYHTDELQRQAIVNGAASGNIEWGRMMEGLSHSFSARVRDPRLYAWPFEFLWPVVYDPQLMTDEAIIVMRTSLLALDMACMDIYVLNRNMDAYFIPLGGEPSSWPALTVIMDGASAGPDIYADMSLSMPALTSLGLLCDVAVQYRGRESSMSIPTLDLSSFAHLRVLVVDLAMFAQSVSPSGGPRYDFSGIRPPPQGLVWLQLLVSSRERPEDVIEEGTDICQMLVSLGGVSCVYGLNLEHNDWGEEDKRRVRGLLGGECVGCLRRHCAAVVLGEAL